MHDLGGKKVEVKPATPKGSGSLSRPGGSSSGSSVRPGGGGGAPGGGRQMQFGGGGSPALFGGQPAPPPFGTAYGMYGFPPHGEHHAALLGAAILHAMPLPACKHPCNISAASTTLSPMLWQA